MLKLMMCFLMFANSSWLMAEFTADDWSQAINVSGRQRMLSQKMAKEYALVLLGIDADANKAAFGKTVALFDKSLNELIAKDPQAKIKKQLEKVRGMWGSYRATLEKFDKAQVYNTSQML